MKFSGQATQNNAVRFSSQVQDDLITLLFDNVDVKLTSDTQDRTASQVSAFVVPVITETAEQASTITVTVDGLISVDPGVRATLCVSIGEQAHLLELPPGVLIQEAPDDTSQQPRENPPPDPHAFERKFSATLPAGVQDILLTVWLLVERIQQSKTAFGRLQIDSVVLYLPPTTVTAPNAD